jgi:hypothetical protein
MRIGKREDRSHRRQIRFVRLYRQRRKIVLAEWCVLLLNVWSEELHQPHLKDP